MAPVISISISISVSKLVFVMPTIRATPTAPFVRSDPRAAALGRSGGRCQWNSARMVCG
jgi:hypothetical protein